MSEINLASRLWPRVDQRGPNECWNWLGAKSNGNGILTVNYKTLSARRVAWQVATGRKPPEDVQVHTHCRNPSCCNPAHLFLATLHHRFWLGVRKAGPDECWPWMKGTTTAGYGAIRRKNELFLAHRLAWEVEHGSIPNGRDVLHECDNPPCCNPAHLFLGDQASNVRDAAIKGRMMRGETHHAAKLDNNKVHEIREQLALGVPATIVAKHFQVHRGTIMDIKHGRTWKHVN